MYNLDLISTISQYHSLQSSLKFTLTPASVPTKPRKLDLYFVAWELGPDVLWEPGVLIRQLNYR